MSTGSTYVIMEDGVAVETSREVYIGTMRRTRRSSQYWVWIRIRLPWKRSIKSCKPFSTIRSLMCDENIQDKRRNEIRILRRMMITTIYLYSIQFTCPHFPDVRRRVWSINFSAIGSATSRPLVCATVRPGVRVTT